MSKCPYQTTAAGTPIADNQNVQAAGQRGPVLMQSYQLLEKDGALQVLHIGHFYQADPDYGGRVAAALDINLDEIIGKAA